jgi:hypothetical protein
MKARIVAFCVVIVALIGASVWFLWPKNTPDPGTGTPSQQVSNNAPYVQLNILQSDLKQTNGKLKVGIQSSDLEDIVKVLSLPTHRRRPWYIKACRGQNWHQHRRVALQTIMVMAILGDLQVVPAKILSQKHRQLKFVVIQLFLTALARHQPEQS